MARASASSPRARARAGGDAAAAAASDAAAAAAPRSPASAALGGRRPKRHPASNTNNKWRASLKRLALVVAAGRLAFLLLAAGLARLLPDYDTSAELVSADCGEDWPRRAAAAAAAASSSPSSPSWLPPPSPSSWGVVWDAVLYHRIAACGYEYEQFAAFFPGLPWAAGRLVRAAMAEMAAAKGPLPPRAFAAAAVLLNNAAFVGAAVLLAHLGRVVLRPESDVVGAGEEEEEEEEGQGGGEQRRRQQPPPKRRAAAAAALAAVERASLAAALLYGLQPAAIFTAIPYTESLFSLLTFAALCCLYCAGGEEAGGGGSGGKGAAAPPPPRWRRLVLLFRFEAASLLFCLAGCMRSNGAVNAAFVLHEAAATALAGIQRAWREEQQRRRQRRPTPKQQQPPPPRSRLPVLLPPLARAAAVALILAARACLCAAAVLAPYVLFQRHVASVFCDGAPVTPMGAGGGEGAASSSSAAAAAAFPPTTPPALGRPDWCDRGGGAVAAPFLFRASYARVQARYWGVGPLAYWRPEQLPNFLLALPVLALTAAGALALYLGGARRTTLLTGGLLPREWELKVEGWWAGASGRRRKGGQGSAARPPPPFSSSRRAAVFVVQWSALALFAALTMNVQVSTRMLCASCPALYWAAAEMGGLGQDQEEGGDGNEARGGGGGGGGGRQRRRLAAATALWIYCAGFALAGAVLNPQFLPWT